MVTKQNFKIIGTGSYLPERKLTAKEMDGRLGMPIGWTEQNIGVLERYECVDPETLISMAYNAVVSALNEAQISWDQIDYLFDCSTSKMRPIPNNACHIQHAFGPEASPVPCLDIQSTCLGSITAINLANSLLNDEAYRNVVIVASERAVAGVNLNQPASAGLVGDGAAAIVLRRQESQRCISFCHQTFAQHLELCRVDGGGHLLPFFEYNEGRDEEFRFTMDGPAVYRVARKKLPPMVRHVLESYQQNNHGFDSSKIQVVPHQASPHAVEAIRRVLGFSAENYHVGIQGLGNLASASIPVMLDRLRKSDRLNPGQDILLLGTSAGYSQAALCFQL